MRVAEEGIARMRETVDSLIVIQNEQILSLVERGFNEPLLKVDDILRQAVQGISDIILKVGVINVDFADVKNTMYGQGNALMGIGIAEGDKRAKEAALCAMENPLLEDITINGAQRILVNVSGGESFELKEMSEVVTTITEKADPEVQIKCGAVIDPELGDKLQVTLIATGFHPNVIPIGGTSSGAGKTIEKEKERLSITEWEEMRTGGTGTRSGLSPRKNYNKEDLDVPAVLRYQSPYSAHSLEQERPAAGGFFPEGSAKAQSSEGSRKDAMNL
jgi:cell division protein FtsZ